MLARKVEYFFYFLLHTVREGEGKKCRRKVAAAAAAAAALAPAAPAAARRHI
jgi:hypothetical protein